MSPSFVARRCIVLGSAAAIVSSIASPAQSRTRSSDDDSAFAAPALAPTLATVYRGQVEPAGCLVSEKYDGVRALWDGERLRHRSGRLVAVPRGFVAALPPVPLDGELWLGRGRFDAVSAIVRKVAPRREEWAGVRYMVFELPGGAGSFAARSQRLAAIVAAAGSPQLLAAPQERIDGAAALQRRLDAVVAGGGEGLVLHVASAPWAAGRSDALLKLKPHLDAEAVVVGHRGGAGKYEGQVGALDVEAADGRRFLVGSGLSDTLRRHPPARGEVITYRYRDLTSSGLPRFATYLRRHDAL